MAKTLADLYCEVGGSEELLKAFAEAAKAGTVLDFVKANGVEATAEEIEAFKAGNSEEAMLSVDELADAAGGGGCQDDCKHEWGPEERIGGYLDGSTKRQYQWRKVCKKCGKKKTGFHW